MNIGIIGLGERSSWIASLLLQAEQGVNIRAIADRDAERAKSKANARSIDTESAIFYSDADEMLDNERLDGVVIGTRCSLHTTMALKALKRNIPLFLEKPVATTMDDWHLLNEAGAASGSDVVVSFPLRVSSLVTLAKEIVDSGKLGTIEHVQAVNNVPYGIGYFQSWYRDAEETGGLFLQKATHDFDYINHLLGIRPVRICAMKSKQIFKGDRQAGLSCKQCEENQTCPEGHEMKRARGESVSDNSMCCFAVDGDNEDSGSALIQYETGMHVSYSQNFFARRGAAARGARLLGYKGTLEFDWYTNKLKVFMHHAARVEKYDLNTDEGGHGGGDEVLAKNFIRVMQGREASVAPLDAGLLSALMCLKAKQSAETNAFLSLD
ncbi:Gfo/Idh/MocA family protein [Cohnella luojiensis]|uniref:Gfo/Idh/MocA family oxidoreductase n=1 Tax=Cohnella luojiensis TaxID=652876 RepID=A0A4Y8LTH8_9BACL|nr:Gfo/Idh/MocA family oxidoreductase [Cohnella luojiensis]TFE24705.1 Gfo/Idh/MocA family oxidoreductase [Cohnella luojiensis]